MEAIETIEVGSCVVKLYPDEMVENPRVWADHPGTHLWVNTRDYDLSDKGLTPPPACRMAYDEDSMRFAARYLGVFEGAVVLPVRFDDYGSSGAMLYLSDADNANGLIWTTAAEIAENWNGDREAARKCLVAEVNEMHQWLTGDVYGYEVEDASENHLDSCWGFYGYEYALQEAKRAGEYACKIETRDRAWAAARGIPTIA